MVRGIVNDDRNHRNPRLFAGQGWGLENSDWEAQRLVMVGEQGMKAAFRTSPSSGSSCARGLRLGLS